MSHATTLATTRRRLPVLGFVGLVVAYLVLVHVVARLASWHRHHLHYAEFTSTGVIWRSLLITIGLGCLFVYGTVAYLRWRQPVFVDDRPVRRWVWTVPAILIASVVGVTNYSGLASKGLAFTVMLLVGALLVGFAEEGLFRGIGVTVFRDAGFTEGKVALWTSLVFGLSHASNFFVEGRSAFVQVFVTAAAGYFLYLTRRVSGGLVVPAVVHALWDFSLFSGTVVAGVTYEAGAFAVPAELVILVILLFGRKKIELPAAP